MEAVFSNLTQSWKSLDYVCGWFLKFKDYSEKCAASAAFVATNSISQGEQVARLWPLLLEPGLRITFAYTSFKWSNLASHKAGVTVAIIGLSRTQGKAILLDVNGDGEYRSRYVEHINPYLVAHADVYVTASTKPISECPLMTNGSKPVDGGNLSLSPSEADALIKSSADAQEFVRPYFGSDEFIKGKIRHCLWIGAMKRAERR